jgi:[ribosomal protein S5]-alanine N-acetyltransferase
MSYILKTKNLTFREFTLSDTDFIITLLNSDGWIKYIGQRNIKTQEQAETYLKNGPMKSYAENGFGLSAVVLTETNEIIGMCGLLKRDTLEHPDIGFAFLDTFMGKGFGYEIAAAVVQYAKAQLNIPTLLAIVMPENNPSRKLLEKIGFSFVEMTVSPNNGEELMLYCTTLNTDAI